MSRKASKWLTRTPLGNPLARELIISWPSSLVEKNKNNHGIAEVYNKLLNHRQLDRHFIPKDKLNKFKLQINLILFLAPDNYILDKNVN